MNRVLLLEPDSMLAQDIGEILGGRGYKIDWQVDPQAAMDSADRAKPSLVILDVLLAGRSGVEFLYEFRSYPEWQDVPIVLYSSLSPEEIRLFTNGFDHLGVAAYLYKPQANIKQLVDTVLGLLTPAAA